MADASQSGDLAKFTEAVAAAMFRAIDARKGAPDDFLDRFRVTTGIWIDPRESPRLPEFPHSAPQAKVKALSMKEVADIAAPRSPVTQQSVGRLNDEISSDPSRALRLLKSLASDPATWDVLFELDEEHRAALEEPDKDFIGLFEGVVNKIACFGDDLSELTFEVNQPAKAGRKLRAAKDGKWWIPDKFELTGKGKDGGWEISGTITWNF